MSSTSGQLPELSDFVAEIGVRFVVAEDGDPQQDSLIDLRGSALGGYSASLDTAETLKILRSDHTDTVALASRKPPVVNDAPQSNTLQIFARGTEMAVLVNGEPAVYANDPAFPSGIFGLTVCNFAPTPLRVHFDNLAIWTLAD
jgi:hypothetical protein